MKRLLIAVPVVLVVAVIVAGVAGAFSSGGTAHAVAAASSSTMPMPMPSTTTATAATGGTGPLHAELHQKLVKVKIMNFAFMPARLEVSPGTRVVWTNQDSDPHTVTTDKPGFSSQALDTGQSYARVMTKSGTFTYHCTIHPFMHGTVVVAG